MTHIETLQAQLKELKANKEEFNKESFALKIKIKFNKTKIDVLENEIKTLSDGIEEDKTALDKGNEAGSQA